tara:strand:+ start:4115 stop:4867 length:753 start_codon:yes stop_codon:yes gene_type:complete
MYYSNKLKRFKQIKHCFFSKKGGYSKGIYKSLNCGEGSNDSKKNVKKNLILIAKKMMVKRNNLFLMYQTHSNKVVEIKKNNSKRKVLADAMITREKNIALGVVTADCIPVILYDKKNNIIACIHAGWKGAFSGIIKNTIYKIKKINNQNKIYASIGPCIGKKSYEVDLEFYKKFVTKTKKNKSYFSFKNKKKKFFDLRKFVSDKLKEQDVLVDNVNRDTFTERNNFFSYRRSSLLKEGDYGRCISVIRLL